MEPNADRPAGRPAALRIAAIAVMAAVTAVFTILVRVPIPGTQGYVHFGDTAVYFAAFALGPFTAAISGGLGTALADIIGGYAVWAPVSLLAHGIQGLLAGLLAGAAVKGATSPERGVAMRWIAGAVLGLIAMVGLYLLGGLAIEGPATVVQIPWNLVQGAVGGALGSSLAVVVRRAYPPVRDLRW